MIKNGIVLIMLIFAGCSSSSKETAPPNKYTKAVEAIYKLHSDANLPEHLFRENPTRNGTEFNVTQYFDVLRHLSPPDGYTLDYVYHFFAGNGRPHLYLRKTTDPPFKTFQAYQQAHPNLSNNLSNTDITNQLHVDGSRESFFELVVFYELAGQFYQSWHCCYNDKRIVISLEDVNQIIRFLEKDDFGTSMTSKQKKKTRQIDTTARIDFLNDDIVKVSLITFTKWGGFHRNIYYISRQYPHRFIIIDKENLVEYDCGVMFKK